MPIRTHIRVVFLLNTVLRVMLDGKVRLRSLTEARADCASGIMPVGVLTLCHAHTVRIDRDPTSSHQSLSYFPLRQCDGAYINR